MAPHRRAFSTAAPITLPPSGPNLVSRGDGQAGTLVTGKSGCLSAQNPGSQAVFAWGPQVASDSLAASHRRSATTDKRAPGMESGAVPLGGEKAAGCRWQPWHLAARALCAVF
jgi:hypothetical protein